MIRNNYVDGMSDGSICILQSLGGNFNSYFIIRVLGIEDIQ